MDVGHAATCVTTGMPALLTGGRPGCRAGDERLAWFKPGLSAAPELLVRSDAFENMSSIPAKYSADGQAISPPLSWSTIVSGAGSLALVVEDPDAPTPNPFVHWLLYNIPADLRGLPEDVRHEEIAAAARGAMQGKNSALKIGWTGMAPSKGDSAHHYHFQLFALDRRLDLAPGAGRTALFEAMSGHVIGRGALIGTYQR
jgi:Raf kinase inhibitor-like YbhB/YbcL family protein